MVALKSFPDSSPRRQPRLHNPNRSRLRLVSSQPQAPKIPSTSPSASSSRVPSQIARNDRFQRRVVDKSTSVQGLTQSGTVKRLDPKHNQLPKSVVALRAIEKVLFVCTLGLGAATMGIYSITVQTQQEWMKKYDHLQNLERYERQLVTASEILKNRMASQVETEDTGLVPQNPDTTIFLEPVEQRSVPAVSESLPNLAPEPLSSRPWGY